MKSAKPAKSSMTTWSMSIPRKSSTVSICSSAPPNAKAALIFWSDCPGIAARVSRGIESFSKAPPPARTSIRVSARTDVQSLGATDPLPAASTHFSFEIVPFSSATTPSGLTSVPMTRIVWPLAIISGTDPWSASAAPSSSFPFWIWAEMQKRITLTRIHAPSTSAPHLRIRRQGKPPPSPPGGGGGPSPPRPPKRSRIEASTPPPEPPPPNRRPPL